MASPGRAKVEAEGVCRVCGHGPAASLDAAHLVPRSLLPQGFEDPDTIVPLCSRVKDPSAAGCHQDFDGDLGGGTLDLLPHLTEAEEVAAVRLMRRVNPRGSGIAGAFRLLGDGALTEGDLWRL